MNKILLNLIVLLHLLFVLFVIITPFIGNNYFLLLHAIVIPFMMAHWYINDNSCFLTIMEKQIRYSIYGELPESEMCFSYKLIAPIYDFKKNHDDTSDFIYLITIILWLISIFRLFSNWKNGKLSKLEDLMK